ncbi:MAG: hypothetical protein O3A00_18735 [Planctomycetota bacterium]|nr:hypothetical protein [Planctomycetota bacterium]
MSKTGMQKSDSDIDATLVAFFRNEVPAELPTTDAGTDVGKTVAAWVSLQNESNSIAERPTFGSPDRPAGLRAARLSVVGGRVNASQWSSSRSLSCVFVGLVTLVLTAVMLVGGGRTKVATGVEVVKTNPDVTIPDSADVVVAHAVETVPNNHPQAETTGFQFSKRFPTEDGPVELRFKLRRYTIQRPPETEIELIIPELDIEFFDLQAEPLVPAPTTRGPQE